MTDADLDFTKTTKPTREQARFIWNSMVSPSCRKVQVELAKRGAKIGFKTINRWRAADWAPAQRPAPPPMKQNPPGPKTKAEQGKVRLHGVAPAVQAVIQATEAKNLIGTTVSAAEVNAIQKDMEELGLLDMPALKAMQEKERLIFNIMIMRNGQRRADVLALIPKEAAALIIAGTEARDVLPMIPPEQASQQPAITNGTGNGHYLDVTPGNPISSAIERFKKQQGVAA